MPNNLGAAVAAVVTAVVALACAGCGPARRVDTAVAASPSPSAAPPDGLTASLVQYRRDQPRRYVEVKLANAGDTALTITLHDVTLPGFTPTGPVDRTTDLAADRRVDLPVPLGDPVCATPPDGAATARLSVAHPDAATVRTTVPVDDDGLLSRLRDVDCAVRRADEAVGITLTPSWRRRGSGRDLTVAGTAGIELADPTATVEITDVRGGLLFVAEPAANAPALPVRLDAAEPSLELKFELLPARCDGHAIAEAKRLTTVTFLVSVGGAEGVPVRRAPDDAGFDTLLAALDERCAAG